MMFESRLQDVGAWTSGGMTEAARLIDVLCEVSLVRWRDTASATANDPQGTEANHALNIALVAADPILLWDLFDDLDTALHRLTAPERDISRVSDRECDVIRATTRSAVGALACAEQLADEHVMTLVAPFVELSGSDMG